MSLAEPNPPNGLHEQVLAQMGPDLVSGALAQGTVLRIDEIVVRHGVSRTVARDVIKVLESLRVVTSRRRVGVTVRPRSEWNLFDPRMIRWRLDGPDRAGQLRSLNELRRGLEPVAAALAATNADAGQRAQLVEAVAAMRTTGESGDLEAYLTHDLTFHRVLFEASGNEMFAGLGAVVSGVLSERTHQDLMPERPEPAAIELHAEVAAAVGAADPARAERAMRAVVDEAQDAIEESLRAR